MRAQIRPAELQTWLSSLPAGARPVVLDVREAWEVQTASVQAEKGFDLLCIPMGELPQRLGELPSGRPIACLCHHGARSQRVADFLAYNGHTSVVNIAGGIDAWSREKDTTVPLY